MGIKLHLFYNWYNKNNYLGIYHCLFVDYLLKY